MDRSSLLFLIGAVVASVALSVFGFSLAALPQADAAKLSAPMPAEEIGMVDLGGGFGEIHALELVGYYLENPPVTSAPAEATAPSRQFGGC